MLIHFTTVHPRGDTRIRVKEVASLAKRLDTVIALFVQDGNGSETDASNNIQVVDTGTPPKGRLARMTLGAWRIWCAVKAARPTVAHFHDPELIPVGLALKVSGIKIVYDVHEDVPRQILGKHWIPRWARRPVSWAMASIEWIAARVFDAIVPATPKIAERFPAQKTVVVQNFPILDELVRAEEVPYVDRLRHFAYVGGVTRIRGAQEMVDALDCIDRGGDVRLRVVGAFQPIGLQTEIEALSGWSYIEFLGWANRAQVAELLGNVRAGLVLFHPLPNHIDAQPNKLFEYMSAGLPVIASDFPLWRRIVAGAGCGLLVDPMDPKAITEAMQWILDHPEEAEAMGRRGRLAVEETYNWEQESDKLLALYRQLLPSMRLEERL